MEWIKKGLIISPNENLWWNKTHNMLPTVVHKNQNLFDLYYSGRDSNNVSHIGKSTIEVNRSEIKLKKTYKEPVFKIGERGCFDDNGVTPSCIIDENLYYIGWNSGTSTYRMSLIMGLAIKKKGSEYKRFSKAPLLQKTHREPFGICTAPFVIKSQNGFKMWYVSGEGWINKDLPKYNIKYAFSKDGIKWENKGIVALELEKNETALARPCVLFNGIIYEMYFSYKDPRKGYRIGYATSKNGINFKRSTDSTQYLNTSKEGWDSEMVEYSFVFQFKGKRYMLYNGNNYGKNGIGYAVRE